MRRQLLGSLASGVLFAAGLCLSGMTNPTKVLGFLDLFGRWDPSLGFVMFGAVGTYALLYRLIMRRAAPLFASRFTIPSKKGLDRSLVVGSALFGVGWGLAGYCPGPVVTSLANGTRSALVFMLGMIVGLELYGALDRYGLRRGSRRAQAAMLPTAAEGKAQG